MSTDTGDACPIAKKPYTLALKHYDWVKEETDKLLEAGLIRESYSSWSVPTLVVPKGDGGKRLCVYYRALNAISRTYVCQCPDLRISYPNWAKQSFSPHFRSGYHHIALD